MRNEQDRVLYRHKVAGMGSGPDSLVGEAMSDPVAADESRRPDTLQGLGMSAWLRQHHPGRAHWDEWIREIEAEARSLSDSEPPPDRDALKRLISDVIDATVVAVSHAESPEHPDSHSRRRIVQDGMAGFAALGLPQPALSLTQGVPSESPILGYWKVKPDHDFTPEEVAGMQAVLQDAVEKGLQLIVHNGITFYWNPIRTEPERERDYTPGPSELMDLGD